MSIRIDAAGDYLSRTSSLPAATPFSICFWVYLVSDRNAVGIIFLLLNSTGLQYQGLRLGADGTTLEITTNNGTTSTGISLSTGQWYHIAYTRNGATHSCIVNGGAPVTRSDNNTLTTPAYLLIGSNGANYSDARFGFGRGWTAERSQAEIALEMQSSVAVNSSNIYGDWRTPDGATRVNDSSANAYHWTANGTLTDEAQPAISTTATMTVGTAAAAGQAVTATGVAIGSATLTVGTATAAGIAVAADDGTVGATATMTVGSAAAAGHSATGHGITTFINLGAIGDSNIDEFRADDNRGGAYDDVTFSPIEMLYNILGAGVVDPGSWGTRAEPRRTGYEYNWSRSAVTAGSVHSGNYGQGDIISNGMHTGLATQIGAGSVDTVLIWVGSNDYAPGNGTYTEIYNGTVSGSELTNKENSVVANLTTALNAIVAAGPVRVVLSNIGDPGEFAFVQASYPNATYRQRVTDSINRVNADIDTLIAAHTNVALMDFNSIATDIDAEYTITDGAFDIAGETIDFIALGDEPHNSNLADGHFGTVCNGIFANIYVIDVLNASLDTDISRLTDAQILAEIGIDVGAATATLTAGSASAAGQAITGAANTGASMTVGAATAAGIAVSGAAAGSVSATVGNATAAGTEATAANPASATASVGDASASGTEATGSAATAAGMTAGGATASGASVVASNPDAATATAGSAQASGTELVGAAAVTAAMTAGEAITAGQAVSGTAQAVASMTAGSAQAAGTEATAIGIANVSAEITAGEASAAGQSVSASGDVVVSAQLTVGEATAAGNGATASVTASASATVAAATAMGIEVSVACNAVALLSPGAATADGNGVGGQAGASAMQTVGSASATGQDTAATASALVVLAVLQILAAGHAVECMAITPATALITLIASGRGQAITQGRGATEAGRRGEKLYPVAYGVITPGRRNG